MSIQTFTLNSVGEVEKFTIPVAKEFFLQVWNRGCKEFGLQWIPLFSTGIDILKKDLILNPV